MSGSPPCLDESVTQEERIRNARNAKIELLLPAFELYAAETAGIARSALDPLGVDAEFVHRLAETTLKGEVVHVAGKRTIRRWNEIAGRGAGLPEERYPSVTTIRAIVDRLKGRVDAAATPVEDLFQRIPA